MQGTEEVLKKALLQGVQVVPAFAAAVQDVTKEALLLQEVPKEVQVDQ